MNMINLKINNMPVSVPEGATILDAARRLEINIPTLCFLKEINEIGACRICVVEVKGSRTLVASCVFPVSEGMEVLTNTPRVQESRKKTLQLILSNHDRKCLACVRSGKCELQALCVELGVEDDEYYAGEDHVFEIDDSAPHMARNNNKCVLCRRCVAACNKLQKISVIGPNERGFDTHISCSYEYELGNVACVSCGQCIALCPTGALYEKDNTEEVWQALYDTSKHVVVQTAPSVRVTLGECFDMPIGTNVQGKMTASLRRLGFDGVFDTDVGADFTIMEEAAELVERIQNGLTLPMFTSCSPGWVKYCEHYYPEFIPNLSTCKSPQQMFGALLKTWYAKEKGIDPKDIYVVSVMPCTAKKFEIGRPDQDSSGMQDVDVVLTTRELSRMIKRAGINFTSLPDEEFDAPLGISTGAAVIFGASGGVMEAALRTAQSWLTGSEAGSVDFKDVRGMEGVKEATYNINGLELNVAAASGLRNISKLLDAIKSGEKKYHFVEFMCCPGGCINGGGQPIQHAVVRNTVDIRKLRASALYSADEKLTLRKSHESPVVEKIYSEYLEKPGSHLSHELFHTTYVKRDRFFNNR